MSNKYNKNWAVEKEIREICTYHGEDGTSGYLLSEEQFKKIFDVIDRVKEEAAKHKR